MGMVSASMLSRQRAKNHFSSKFPQRDKDNNHDDDVNGSNGGERHFIAKDVYSTSGKEKKPGKVGKNLQHKLYDCVTVPHQFQEKNETVEVVRGDRGREDNVLLKCSK